jgi:hypothetical protein
MGGMTVRELLARIDSRELTEWAAYEHYAGPLGPSWSDEATALSLESLQQLSHLIGAGLLTDRTHPNPVPPPERVPRPHEAVGQDSETDGG